MLETALLLLALSLPSPQKVAVMPLSSGEGVPGKTAEALTESVSAEVRHRSGGTVITEKEITTLLSLEQQKAMLGCGNDACFAELGGALGVEEVVSGDLSRLGESWLFHLRLLDAKKAQVLATSDRRLKGGTIDDVLDALPAMVAELFPQGSSSSATSAPSPEAVPGKGERAKEAAPSTRVRFSPPPAPPRAPPPGDAEGPSEPLPPATAPMPSRAVPARAVLPAYQERSIPVPLRIRAEMQVFSDGKGGLLALTPFGGPQAPVFYGSRQKLFRQEVLDRRELGTTRYEVLLWEPRVAGGKAVVVVTGERALVRCGERELELSSVGPREGRRTLVAATYYAPPFVRRPVGLARDDEGNFFLVDAARNPGERGPDYRLYTGPKGSLARVEILGLGREGDLAVLLTSQGRLRFGSGGEAAGPVDWISSGGKRALLPLETAKHLPLIFGALGIYGEARLGTLCDDLLSPPAR